MLNSELRVGQIFTIVEKSEELGDNAVSVVVCRLLHYIDQAGVSQISSVCYVVCNGTSRFLEPATIYTINPTFFIENYGAGLVKPEPKPVVGRSLAVTFAIRSTRIRITRAGVSAVENRLSLGTTSHDVPFDDETETDVFANDIDGVYSMSRSVYSLIEVLQFHDDITDAEVPQTIAYLVDMFRLFVPSFQCKLIA